MSESSGLGPKQSGRRVLEVWGNGEVVDQDPPVARFDGQDLMVNIRLPVQDGWLVRRGCVRLCLTVMPHHARNRRLRVAMRGRFRPAEDAKTPAEDAKDAGSLDLAKHIADVIDDGLTALVRCLSRRHPSPASPVRLLRPCLQASRDPRPMWTESVDNSKSSKPCRDKFNLWRRPRRAMRLP
ncbi:hypothetical protein VTI74DRAFT_3227 [Chaetomium olivicolor]